MTCYQCGASIADGLAFCPKCGHNVGNAQAVNPAVCATPEYPVTTAFEAEQGIVDTTLSEGIADTSAQIGQRPTARRTIIETIVSILVSLALFVSTIALIAFIVVRPGNISYAVTRADASLLLEEIGLREQVTSGINIPYMNSIMIDVYSLNDFLRRSSVRDEIGKIAEKYITAVATGDFGYHISSREVVGFLRALSSEIREEFGVRLTNEEYDAISTLLTREHLKGYSAGRLLTEAGVDIAIPYVLLSVFPLMILGILCAMTTYDIFLLNTKKIRLAFLNAGIPIALSGFLCAVAGLLFGPFSGLLGSGDLFIAARIAAGVANVVLVTGLVFLAVGAVSIGTYIAIKKLRKGQPTKCTGYVPSKKWRYVNLAINISAVIVCAVLALLCLRDLPTVSEKSRYARVDAPYAMVGNDDCYLEV